MMEKPIVTVGVITYNSSKYVLETLESIKAQTYQPLKLIIGDDCSTDNTVEICRKWIEENKSRFISTRIIVPEHNTGVSGNCNRTMDACDTVWYKEIAGDDILLPNCIQDYIDHVSVHPDTIIVFGYVKAFGLDADKCKDIEETVFIKDFFEWNVEMQLKYLQEESNCVPAPTAFYNLELFRQHGLRNDERIPFMEDWPKWINVLLHGIKLQTIGKETVLYRLHSASMTSSGGSLHYWESCRLFDFYYRFEPLYLKDPDAALKRLLNYERRLYMSWKSAYNDVKIIQNSIRYKLGSFFLYPFIRACRLFRKA